MLRFFFAQWSPLFLALLTIVALTSCSTATIKSDSPIGSHPTKSPNDSYDYRLITLANELQVLLISDPDTPKAAASLAVMVGSGDNPSGRGGLAHFLEHMLFLGTAKYPDAAEYERYITEHGGNRNAYTSFDHTNYFFDINAEFLPEALDRFAQFFISPSFDEQYVEREKNAVHAEYQMGLKSDGRRGLDVLQEVMNPQHPYSQFAVGSLESLDDREGSTVRDELLTFYDKYYSSNLMRLVVLGSESLDELETLVVPMFSEVPNRNTTQELIEPSFFVEEELPMLVQVQPLATQRQLEVSFPVADYRARYRAKPTAYLGNVLGHEGEGSLLSQLKAEGLAESLSAGEVLSWRGGALFGLSIALTEVGSQQYQRILKLLFAHLEMLREQGPQEWLYQEQSQLAGLSFRYREPGNPVSYVSALASGMHYYDPKDVLQGPYLMDRYDEEMLEELIAKLRPEKAIVTLHDVNAQVDKISSHYEVPYSKKSIDSKMLRLAKGDEARDALALPKPNAFIAQDVSLRKISRKELAQPELLVDQSRQRIWYMPDDEFRVPKGTLFFGFRSKELGQTIEQSALARLYSNLLMDNVNEFSYAARLAGLGFSFSKHSHGIGLRVRGYNDKQLDLLKYLLSAAKDPRFDAQRFDNIKQDIIRSLNNTSAKRPSSQVMGDLSESVRFAQWGEEEMIAALTNIELPELEAYIHSFWLSAKVEGLVYGNYDRSVVEEVSTLLSDVISSEPPADVSPTRVLKLAPAQELQYIVDVPHDDAVVAWYLQGRGNSWVDRAATALTSQIMKSGFFQQLRTEQQLGYVVSVFNWTQVDVPGLVMLVQSPVVDATAIVDAMDAFMKGVSPALDQEQFDRHKTSLVSDITRPHKNLGERADFLWRSISQHRYDFSSREHLAEAVESLTLDDWRAYYQQVFIDERHSLQVVAPGGAQALPGNFGKRYDAAKAIKKNHPAYEMSHN